MKQQVLIIAEAGVNHNGDIKLAKQLIDVAAEAQVDYVKFQTFKAEKLTSKSAAKAQYQMDSATDKTETQYEMLKRLELSEDQHLELMAYCEKKGVTFLSTGFDLESLDNLNRLGIDRFKVPSGELTNLPYLRRVASFGKPIILSTGMADMQEVGEALAVFEAAGIDRNQLTVLHCNTEYPTPMEDVNLKAMQTMAEEFGVNVGYSDHTLGIEVPIAAVAMGATVIEKHFTLDRTMEGPDHKASLEPQELKAMVTAIRHIEKALGDGIKRPSASELKNKVVARKSIVAKIAIKKGEVFSENNLTVKRPGGGLSPMRWDVILGQTATRDYQPDDFIE
ncbi:N-acetylneuraminate synthase [uncultured Winogradskyella sp.]|uniref:N-acetylneuraminate synthase n=1 Tax=uncultured Winogradskyella sp. TaxID=395353 RepID=UPI0035150B09